jgi:hypothetical protein
MITENLTPKQIKRAKELASGPLGQQLAKYPLRFAAAVLISERPNIEHCTPKVNNGTVTLINFGNGPIAITCSHVIDGYRKRQQYNKNTTFQIGCLEIDPLRNLIDENAELDLATIDLKNHDLSKIHSGGEIGSCFLRPVAWPPNDIAEGDYVTFGGFPGTWSKQSLEFEFVFPSFSSLCPVASVNEDYFVIQFERGYWVETSDYTATENWKDLHELGGLSGGPVFIHRSLHFELVGIIQEFSKSFDLTRVRKSKFIGEDGCIKVE